MLVVGIGTGHPTNMGVLIEVAISLASIVIKAVFLKREREDLNFECPPVKSVDRSLDSKNAFDPVINMSYCSEAWRLLIARSTKKQTRSF